MVAKAINFAMRGLQFIWTLLLMSLIGNMIHEANNGNTSIVNYAMFVAVFGMLSLFYLIPATISEGFAFSPIILASVDGLNSLFWFCGAVAFPAYLHVGSCSNFAYTNSNRVTQTTSPGNQEKRCREAQASVAFLWFGWAAFTASAVLSALGARGSGANMRGGMRKGGPSMSTV